MVASRLYARVSWTSLEVFLKMFSICVIMFVPILVSVYPYTTPVINFYKHKVANSYDIEIVLKTLTMSSKFIRNFRNVDYVCRIFQKLVPKVLT